MPDPRPDAYNRYREGLVRRHIVCCGRYLSELWLKDYEANKDAGHLLRNKRVFHVPAIPSFVELKTPLLQGVYEAPFERHWGPFYIEITPDHAKYNLPMLGEGTLRDKEKTEFLEWYIGFNQGQTGHWRTFVPWLSGKNVIYGGGDNPLLRGGIAMATFAVEYMVKRRPSSLRYAVHLLRYFEKSEQDSSGLLARCDNHFNVSGELGKNASMDEIVGLLLGLYYLFRATEGKAHLQRRVRDLTGRIAAFLQRNGYLIVSPINHELHRGFSGGLVYQWALQQAFEKITGQRYDPTPAQYETTARALLEVVQDRYTDENGKVHYRRIRYGATGELDQLVAIMWLWGKFGYLSQELIEKWDVEVRARIANVIPENMFISASLGATLAQNLIESILAAFTGTELDIAQLADPFHRYLLGFRIQAIFVYLWNTESWFNNALSLHTLHYALDAEVIQKNNDSARATSLAAGAQVLIKRIICGERVPRPSGPFAYEVGAPDDDFYAAVIAKGLLRGFVPSIMNTECEQYPATVPVHEVTYGVRVDAAIDRRERLWPELPLGELGLIRIGKWPGKVRWHNSYIASSAKKGMDFCWERDPIDADETNRIMRWRGVAEPKNNEFYATERATGLPVNRRDITRNWTADTDVKSKAAQIDVVVESGGLDFMFPRVLMSLWLGEPLEFIDSNLDPLRGVTCLPFRANGGYRRARCHGSADWLLLSSSMR